MPQYRKLYVKTVESIDINDMPDDFTRLFWVLLPLGLDAEGRGLDNAGWIKAKIMPLREDVTAKMIETAMTWLIDRGMIERYEIDGRRYFMIPTWHDYQGDTRREAKSLYPAHNNSRPAQDRLKSKSMQHEYESVYESESTSELDRLQTAFINASGIPGLSTSDIEIYEQLASAGCKPEDITEAVGVLQRKRYTIKSVNSILTTAVNIAKQRAKTPAIREERFFEEHH